MGDPVWASHYADADIDRGPKAPPAEPTAEWAQHLQVLRHHSHSELLTDDFVRSGARQYYAMISLIDQRIGDVLRLLGSRGMLDNTWLVYASDHGEMLGAHQLMAKMNFYAPSVCVPAIMRPPGGTTGQVVATPVQAVDLPATILDIAGAPPLAAGSGRSLLPAVRGAVPDERPVFSEISLFPGMPAFCAVSDGRWRLTMETGSGTCCELFDLVNDPEENQNLVGLKVHRTEQDHYMRLCREFMADKAAKQPELLGTDGEFA
jgi:arylsulfatase A-like enzyme